MTTMARAGPGFSQEPGATSGSPTSEQEPKYLGHLQRLFPGALVGAGVEVEQLGQELAPIWDARIKGGRPKLIS